MELIIIGVIVLIVCIYLAFIIATKVKKSLDENYKTAIDYDKIDGKSQLVRHVPFMWPKEVEFYDTFRTLLPSDYLMIPKVSVDKIVKPHGSLVLYNAVKNKFVDYVIIKRSNMEPVMVIDCFYPAITDSNIKELDKAVQVALKAVNIPVLTFEILDIPYDRMEMYRRFLDALDPIALAELKKENLSK